MPSSAVDCDSCRDFALAAGDLFVTADAGGAIRHAEGEAGLLHYPTADRLLGRNVLDLIGEGETHRLREDLWALAPGRRLTWETSGAIEDGRRYTVRRSPETPELFHIVVARISRVRKLRGERTDDVLAERFRDAIMNGRLKAARQPVVNIGSGVVSHYEMLARFSGEDSPLELITAAEKSGQISHLDYIMVEAAARRLSQTPDPAYRLAVNISGDSLQNYEVVRELCAAILGHEFGRDRLIIEVTESSEITDIDTAARSVVLLRSHGVGVSLDDFGAGAASFGYLRDLDVNGLKFDGGFLRAPSRSSRGFALMRSVARMCADLGISPVGEKVETEEDLRLLIDAGVPYAQGYLFGRPAIDETFFVRSRRGGMLDRASA
jgi:EAL domain-containing protein (putative c-di-GMP-specific phosphodiesterase class I)